MNFKQLFPTFRNRYRFIKSRLRQYSATTPFQHALNLGTGEGDYDRMVAAYCQQLTGCDVNEEDLVHARALNAGVMNLHYEVNNALALTYPDHHFDLIVNCEVIEHVGQPELMIREMHRVLRKDGLVLMTYPSQEFPITYDPVNRVWQWLKKPDDREYLISQGAYAFGHEYLIGAKAFRQWVTDAGFEIVEFRGLSHHLTGLAEVYWTGIVQRIFKKNARNVNDDTAGTLKIRPNSTDEPALAKLTDLFLSLDALLFGWSNRSVGKGIVLRKK